MKQTAPCNRCGKEMQWTGKILLFCEHCGYGQGWPTKACQEKKGERNDSCK